MHISKWVYWLILTLSGWTERHALRYIVFTCRANQNASHAVTAGHMQSLPVTCSHCR